jgi:hypothetical protein
MSNINDQIEATNMSNKKHTSAFAGGLSQNLVACNEDPNEDRDERIIHYSTTKRTSKVGLAPIVGGPQATAAHTTIAST